jgi:hypothetical protein
MCLLFLHPLQHRNELDCFLLRNKIGEREFKLITNEADFIYLE